MARFEMITARRRQNAIARSRGFRNFAEMCGFKSFAEMYGYEA